MSHDRWTRRTGAVLVCAGVLAVSNGCRRSPFQRLDGPPAVASPGGAAKAPEIRRSLPLPLPLIRASASASTRPETRGTVAPSSPVPAAAASLTFPLSPIPPEATTRVPPPGVLPRSAMPTFDQAGTRSPTAAPPVRDPALDAGGGAIRKVRETDGGETIAPGALRGRPGLGLEPRALAVAGGIRDHQGGPIDRARQGGDQEPDRASQSAEADRVPGCAGEQGRAGETAFTAPGSRFRRGGRGGPEAGLFAGHGPALARQGKAGRPHPADGGGGHAGIERQAVGERGRDSVARGVPAAVSSPAGRGRAGHQRSQALSQGVRPRGLRTHGRLAAQGGPARPALLRADGTAVRAEGRRVRLPAVLASRAGLGCQRQQGLGSVRSERPATRAPAAPTPPTSITA